jgi:hypothetical protein
MKLQFGNSGQIRSNTGKSYANVSDVLHGYGLEIQLHSLHNSVYVLEDGWHKSFVIVPVGFEDDFIRMLGERNDKLGTNWKVANVWKGEPRS